MLTLCILSEYLPGACRLTAVAEGLKLQAAMQRSSARRRVNVNVKCVQCGAATFACDQYKVVCACD